jgi:hypothetical protein
MRHPESNGCRRKAIARDQWGERPGSTRRRIAHVRSKDDAQLPVPAIEPDSLQIIRVEEGRHNPEVRLHEIERTPQARNGSGVTEADDRHSVDAGRHPVWAIRWRFPPHR